MNWGTAVTYLGSTTLKEKTVQFGIKDADRLKHLCVLGRTDTGRASFLVHMALQDIERGLGAVILDGSGKVTPQLIERLDPSLSDNIIHLDPAQAEYPYSWNPLDDIKKLPSNVQKETLASLISTLYELPQGPFLNHLAELLLKRNDTSLITPHLLITEEKARAVFFENDDKGKKAFEEYLQGHSEIIELFENHGRYVGKDTLIRNLLGQPQSKFTLRETLKGKIVIVDLSHIRIFPTRMKPLVRTFVDVARTIGVGATAPALVYLHDCLRYLGEDDIERMFSAKNVALTVADTVIQELDKEKREFAISRCGSIASFTAHPGDKAVIERAFYPYAEVEELSRLGKDELIMALTIDSVRGRPFFAKVSTLPQKRHISYQDMILESRKRYTTARTDVDAHFKKLKGEKETPKKRGGGGFQDAFKNIMENRAQNMPLKDLNTQGAKAAGPSAESTKKEKTSESESGTKEEGTKKEEKRGSSEKEKSTAEIAEDALRQLLYVAPVSVMLFFSFPFFAFASVSISEIMYDLPGNDSGREWVELYNSGPAVDVSEWKFFEGGVNHGLTTLSSPLIPQNGYAIIADDSSVFLQEYPSFSGIIFDSVFSLNNASEELILRDGSLNDIDRVVYTSNSGASGDGKSLHRSGSVFTVGESSPGMSSPMSSSEVPLLAPTTISEATRGTITDGGLTVTISVDRELEVGESAIFSAEAYGIKGAPLSNMRFIWDFGNSALREGKSVAHAFSREGSFTVGVVATNGVYTAKSNIDVTVLRQSVTAPSNETAAPKVLASAAAKGLVTSPILAVDSNLKTNPQEFPPFFGWFLSLIGFIGVAIIGVLFVKNGAYTEYSITEIKE